MTFDALHATRARMEQVVVGKGADYLIQVKGNTPALAAALERALDKKHDLCRSAEEDLDYGHGRIETRGLEMVPISPMETQWPHTYVACRVDRCDRSRNSPENPDFLASSALAIRRFASGQRPPVYVTVRGRWSETHLLPCHGLDPASPIPRIV